MANIKEMTREGYDQLNAELERLVTVTRKENAERLKEAISYGDISENSEYDAAKDAQAETEERINEIEAILRSAKVVDESGEQHEDETKFRIGRTVVAKDLDYDEIYEFMLVGSSEADPFNGKLSNESAVGQALQEHKAGDIVEFAIPDGIARYEILEVRR